MNLSDFSEMNQAVLNRTEGYNVSERYNVINTMDVIQEFTRFGFDLQSIDSGGVRTSEKVGAQKHMVRMSADFKMTGGLRPEVIIHNSYDGTKALNIRVGVFRFVCSNGLIMGSNLIPTLQIRHSVMDWQSLVHEFVDTYEEKHAMQKEWVESMMARKMGLDEAYHMAEKSLSIRHSDNRIENEAIDPLELLIIRRREDKGDNAWVRFNTLQENLQQGNYRKYGTDGSMKKAKIMTNVDEIIRFNVELSDMFAGELV